MNKQRPTIENPLAGLSLEDEVRNITHEGETKDNEVDNPVKQKSTRASVKRQPVNKKSDKKSFPRDITESIIEGCITFDKSSDRGKAVRIPSVLIDVLQDYCDKYYKRLSVRTMVSALIQTFVNDFNGEEVIDKFMDRVHYVAPTEEELAARKEAAEKAKAMRVAAKKILEENKEQQTKSVLA